MDEVKPARKSRAMPPDFPAFARLKSEELRERYHCGKDAVARWRKECGIRLCDAIPAPDGFREVAPLRTLAELRRMYGRSGTVIYRWAREAGVTLKRTSERPRRAYVKHDDAAAEIEMCLNCPLPQCRHGKCARIGR